MDDRGRGRRSPLRLAVGAAMVLTGVVWMLQGLGILTAARSFMVGDRTWTIIGIVFIVGGVAVAWRASGGRR
jgi:hypothetical protein